MINKTVFGRLDDGREVHLFGLKNRAGGEAKIIEYGAGVVSLTAPDRNGDHTDIVLGYDSLDGYVKGESFLGAIVGRYANRIARGQFTIDGKSYQVSVNNGNNHLHGGKMGYYRMLWKSEASETKLGPSVRLSHVGPDGEEGYPGSVAIVVTYTLTDENELRIDYEGTTDKPTVLNPSHHSYFNLTGTFANTILDHELRIYADTFVPVDETLIPTGEIAKVGGTPMDFRKATRIGARIDADYQQLKIGNGYDHNWVLNNHSGRVREAAEVYEPTTGRLLQVFTDQPGMQFYSGNSLDGSSIGKNGVPYRRRSGLCLEAQHYPDSPNRPQWPSAVLRPGEVYRQTTIYKFSAK